MPYVLNSAEQIVAPVTQQVEVTTARVVGFRFADERDVTNCTLEPEERLRFDVLLSRGFDGPSGYVEVSRDTVRLSLGALVGAMGGSVGAGLKTAIYAALVADGALPEGTVE